MSRHNKTKRAFSLNDTPYSDGLFQGLVTVGVLGLLVLLYVLTT